MGAYLRNLTLSLIGELHIDKDELVGEFGTGAQTLYERRSEDLKARLKKMRPETLGRIISHGRAFGPGHRKTSLYEVHCGNYSDKYADGRSHLVTLACTAVVAEATDILGNQLAAEFHAGGHEGVLQG